MNQLTIEQAFELLTRSEMSALGETNDLDSARSGGIEAYNDGLALADCPYPADRSARRRAVWQASWLQQRGYRMGLDRTHVPSR